MGRFNAALRLAVETLELRSATFQSGDGVRIGG